MYSALTDLLSNHSDVPLDIICHLRVRLLICDFKKLTEEERRYASPPNTHVDFLIYNRISKTPVLVIEVDGFHYHKDGTVQAKRDKLKNSILAKYPISFLRLPTNRSYEIEKIEHILFGARS